MIRTVLVWLCVGASFSLAAWRTLSSPSVQEEIGDVVWENKLAAAVAKAKQENKPLLVVFRCPP